MRMRTENEQVRNPDPKRSRKLVLHKETIKNLAPNGSPKKVVNPLPTCCNCSNPAASCNVAVEQ